jgi:hypothetical protein
MCDTCFSSCPIFRCDAFWSLCRLIKAVLCAPENLKSMHLTSIGLRQFLVSKLRSGKLISKKRCAKLAPSKWVRARARAPALLRARVPACSRVRVLACTLAREHSRSVHAYARVCAPTRLCAPSPSITLTHPLSLSLSIFLSLTNTNTHTHKHRRGGGGIREVGPEHDRLGGARDAAARPLKFRCNAQARRTRLGCTRAWALQHLHNAAAMSLQRPLHIHCRHARASCRHARTAAARCSARCSACCSARCTTCVASRVARAREPGADGPDAAALGPFAGGPTPPQPGPMPAPATPAADSTPPRSGPTPAAATPAAATPVAGPTLPRAGPTPAAVTLSTGQVVATPAPGLTP